MKRGPLSGTEFASFSSTISKRPGVLAPITRRGAVPAGDVKAADHTSRRRIHRAAKTDSSNPIRSACRFAGRQAMETEAEFDVRSLRWYPPIAHPHQTTPQTPHVVAFYRVELPQARYPATKSGRATPRSFSRTSTPTGICQCRPAIYGFASLARILSLRAIVTADSPLSAG